MSVPTTTPFADDAYARLAPAAQADATGNYALLQFVIALALMFERVGSVARATATRRAWQVLLDPDLCPAVFLPWLGQFVGVFVTPGATEAQQRAQIKAESGFQRGSIGALASAVADTLTGTKSVRITERLSNDAYQMLVVTDPAETPNTALTIARANGAKAAGIVLTVATSSLPLVDEGTRTIDAGLNTIDAAAIADVT